jgi:hypothetical protein
MWLVAEEENYPERMPPARDERFTVYEDQPQPSESCVPGLRGVGVESGDNKENL